MTLRCRRCNRPLKDTESQRIGMGRVCRQKTFAEKDPDHLPLFREMTEMIATRHNVPINPQLPDDFDCTDNRSRPGSHLKWWNRPYIETETWKEGHSCPREKWFTSWPSGTRYDVRCLDGGAWDRPTCWGMFGTLEEALACARTTANS